MSAAAAAPSDRTERAHAAWLAAVDGAIAVGEEPGAFGARAPAVSGWSVGQHLEHLRLADQGMVGWLEGVAEGRTTGAREGGPSLVGRLVLWTGFILRGQGRAPEPTRPAEPEPARTVAGLREVRDRVEALGPRLPALEAAAVTRSHPVLGHFASRHWLRFAGVHHRHHHKIVRDILAAAGSGAAKADDGG